MKLVSVVGARPQFVKAAPLSRALRRVHHEILVHTGQHYDEQLSAVFFRELDIPLPDYQLGIGSGSHGAQTGAMLAAIEQVLLQEKPERVLVYGDTNSTLAAALAAAKLQIPVAHVEAGLRSFNRGMPEELNRLLTDHLADQLFCPSQTAVDNLAAEGIVRGVHWVGDIMADALLAASQRSAESLILERLGLSEKGYLLLTVHRAENTDHPARLECILDGLGHIPERVVFPLHPRTRRVLQDRALSLEKYPALLPVEPLGYIDMIRLERSARMILTDSGGVQKEAYWLSIPCVTLRDETEWVETVESGWNCLVGADSQRIREAVRNFQPAATHPALYGDGQTAARIVAVMKH